MLTLRVVFLLLAILLLAVSPASAEMLPKYQLRPESFVPVSLPAALRKKLHAMEGFQKGLRGVAIDLNGDKVDDDIIISDPDFCGTGGCSYEIIDGRSKAIVGEMFGDPLFIFDQKLNGFPVLSVYSHSSADSGRYCTCIFGGKAYAAVSCVDLAGKSLEDLFSKYEHVPRMYGTEGWIDIGSSGKGLVLTVERTLYEKDGSPHFFIHVKIVNTLGKPIGVDLRDPWLAVYPNQWTASDLDYRIAIDEETMLPKKLDGNLSRELLEVHRAGKFKSIPPGGALDYYVNFNAGGRAKVEEAQGKYLLISLKGQMFFSDGAKVWDENADYDLPLLRPFSWKRVPFDATVIMH